MKFCAALMRLGGAPGIDGNADGGPPPGWEPKFSGPTCDATCDAESSGVMTPSLSGREWTDGRLATLASVRGLFCPRGCELSGRVGGCGGSCC